jgi:hypothetical protein
MAAIPEKTLPVAARTTGMECQYCGSDLAGYDPVFVEETGADGGRIEAGAFCNYACLAAHIDDAGLTDGDACEWSPGADGA